MLTRNPLANVISKLTPEQATMQFIYGESIESSGGNPEEAGRFKREFFLDPFVAGDRLEHAMIFYEILRKSRIKCYLANTGTIGQDELKVALRQSLATYNDLLRYRRFSYEPDYLGCTTRSSATGRIWTHARGHPLPRQGAAGEEGHGFLPRPKGVSGALRGGIREDPRGDTGVLSH